MNFIYLVRYTTDAGEAYFNVDFTFETIGVVANVK